MNLSAASSLRLRQIIDLRDTDIASLFRNYLNTAQIGMNARQK